MNAYVAFYLRRDGRVSRRDFWLKFLAPVFAMILVAAIMDHLMTPGLSPGTAGPLVKALSPVLLYPQTCLTVKRYHDRGLSGWWLPALLIGTAIVMVGAVAAIYADGRTLEAQAGAEQVVTLVLLAAFIVHMLIVCQSGMKGANKYGPDPLATTAAPSVAPVIVAAGARRSFGTRT